MLVLTKRAIRYARLTVTTAKRTRRAQRSTRGPPPDDHYVTVARVRHDDADHHDSLTRAVARVGTVSTSIGSLDRPAGPPVPRR